MSARMLGPGDLALRAREIRERAREDFDRRCSARYLEISSRPALSAKMWMRFCESTEPAPAYTAGPRDTLETVYGLWLQRQIEREVSRGLA